MMSKKMDGAVEDSTMDDATEQQAEALAKALEVNQNTLHTITARLKDLGA
jgi:fructoselysine-6-P-deglycase FrlB-like protein